jgi:hypothetical protein
MNFLFKHSLENKSPIELIYINSEGEFTHRTIIVRKITSDRILAFDIDKHQLKTFKQLNILSAAKQRSKRSESRCLLYRNYKLLI